MKSLLIAVISLNNFMVAVQVTQIKSHHSCPDAGSWWWPTHHTACIHVAIKAVTEGVKVQLRILSAVQPLLVCQALQQQQRLLPVRAVPAAAVAGQERALHRLIELQANTDIL